MILIVLMINANAVNYKIPQVLVIQSYHSGYLWTDNVNQGISTTLKKYNSNIRIKTEYLDTKRFTTEAYIKSLKAMLEFKYTDVEFDVIIVSDNDGFELVKKVRESLFTDIPLVFCGLNFFERSQLGNLTKVTGVTEKNDFLKNFELIKKIHPNVEEILVINDLTLTGKLNRMNLADDIRKFHDDVKIEIIDDISLPNLQEKLRNLSSTTIVLYSHFFKDSQDRYFDYDESILLVTEASNVPVYITNDFSLGYNSVGGFLRSGYSQGESAAKLSIKILQGEDPDKLSIIDISPNSYYFDYGVLQRWGISINQLPKDFQLINYEQSYFVKHKALIIEFLIILTLLSAIIIWLIMTLIKKNKLKNDFEKSNKSLKSLKANLENLVQERTSDLENERNFINKVLDNEEALVIVFRENGKIARTNKYTINNLEYQEDSLLQQDIWTLLDNADDIVELKEYIAQFKQNSSELVKQLKMISKSGKIIMIDAILNSIYINSQAYFILTGINVTEKHLLFKRLESEEKRYRSVYENTGISMITVSHTGMITMVNKEFESLSGYTRDEMLNKMQWQAFVDEESRLMIMNKRELRLQNMLPFTETYEIKIIHKKGFVLDVMLNVVMIKDSNEIIYSLTDITAQTAVKNKMKDLLEEQKAFNEVKNNFLHDFSNELSNPLSSLYGVLDLINYSTDDLVSNDHLDMLQEIARKMLYTVQEMKILQLDDSKSHLDIKECKLDDYLVKIFELIFNVSNIKTIFLKIDPGVHAYQYFDDNKLMKVLLVLIIKLALKNSQDKVLVEITEENQTDLKICLSLIDEPLTGENIIEISNEGSAKRRNFEFTIDYSFNLSIVTKLINLLEGKISYDTFHNGDSGYSFTIKKFTANDVTLHSSSGIKFVNLEISAFSDSVPKLSKSEIEAIYPLKVLIVNYSNMNNAVLFRILEMLNQKVEVCLPKQEVRELINSSTYDLIFFDHNLVSVNNIEVLQEMKTMDNIYQPYLVSVNAKIQYDGGQMNSNPDYILFNCELPELLSIRDIASIIERATEFKNSKI